jgi:hypothetical protein
MVEEGGLLLIHPIISTVTVLLYLTNVYLGISRNRVINGSTSNIWRFRRDLHIKIGKAFITLLYITFSLGLIGVSSTETIIFSTLHAYLGLILLFLFGAGAVIALQILEGNLKLIRTHGRVMLFGGVLLLFQMIGGIGNMKGLRII